MAFIFHTVIVYFMSSSFNTGLLSHKDVCVTLRPLAVLGHDQILFVCIYYLGHLADAFIQRYR